MVPVVSKCKELAPGMTRIGDQYGLQFDALLTNFAIHEGTSDTIPVVHGFRLRLKNTESALEISFGQRPLKNMAIDPVRIFSKHVEQRSIFDDQGHSIGEDYWGYLNTGGCWRQARFFKGGVVAEYGFVNEKEAELFNQVISSACLLSASGS
jgi:hypothetical protein